MKRLLLRCAAMLGITLGGAAWETWKAMREH